MRSRSRERTWNSLLRISEISRAGDIRCGKLDGGNVPPIMSTLRAATGRVRGGFKTRFPGGRKADEDSKLVRRSRGRRRRRRNRPLYVEGCAARGLNRSRVRVRHRRKELDRRSSAGDRVGIALDLQ